MFGGNPSEYGFRPALYVSLLHNDVKLVEGDHDIYGNGAVRIISTPGHTPGHCSLLINLPKTGMVLLSGDAAHSQRNFRGVL
jgi:glyoxylase-like metal-dependent hydrolase (beta-lactamase superfamily II)